MLRLWGGDVDDVLAEEFGEEAAGGGFLYAEGGVVGQAPCG